MRRAALILFVLVAMLWQSAVSVRAVTSSDSPAELQHAFLHWQEQGHHHHHDGSFHLDDSDESASHLMADNVNVTALLPHAAPQLLAAGRAELRLREARAGPAPYLDGLIRPPRSKV